MGYPVKIFVINVIIIVVVVVMQKHFKNLLENTTQALKSYGSNLQPPNWTGKDQSECTIFDPSHGHRWILKLKLVQKSTEWNRVKNLFHSTNSN